jgi:hypothetical protein
VPPDCADHLRKVRAICGITGEIAFRGIRADEVPVAQMNAFALRQSSREA